MYENGKMKHIEPIPSVREENKGEQLRGDFKYDIL
jgi:hypothetical protein